MGRRQALLEAVSDAVLARGLMDLTLRPLAAAVGTSDRMLIYHFGSRDGLISAVLTHVGGRAGRVLEETPAAADVASAVQTLWGAYRVQPLRGYLSLYCQAAATGLLGREPYLSEARSSNRYWTDCMGRYFERSGAPAHTLARVVSLVDSALIGFHLDLATDERGRLQCGVDDLARSASALASGRS